MSSEPPAETSPMQDEGLAAEPHEPSGNGMQGRWRSITTVVGVLAVAGGIAAFLFLSSEPDPRDGRTVAVKGLACSYLRRAAEAFEKGDRDAFDQAIARAAEVAEDTLQKSGQVFGEPERIALELELGQIDDPERLLIGAQDICSELERPSPS
jgi:hypothetical protein